MWNAIANMIIKAADNMNRGVENAGKAGEGNNGVDYSNVDTGGEGGGSGSGSVGGYQQPEGQNTSGVESTTSAVKGIANMAKDAITNVGSKGEDTGGKEEKKPTDNISGEEEKKPTDNIGGGAVSAPTTSAPTTSTPTSSDERLKRIFGDNPDAIQAFAKLDSIQFTYNDKAKEVHPNEENGVDNDLHYGIKAQDLEKNPFTAAVVSKDPEGFKQIDPAELTAANTGVIAEICKRLLIIEKVLGIKVV